MDRKIILVVLIAFCFSSCYVFKAIRYKDFNLKDIDNLPYQTISASSKPFIYPEFKNKYPKLSLFLDTNLINTYTYSFLVIHHDTIVYEKYFDNVNMSTILPSFSVAKSFVGTLVGIAYEEGKIKSLDEPITNYIIELKNKKHDFSKITIQDLLDMKSGIAHDENYSNPFRGVIKMGFMNNIMNEVKHLKIEKNPGEFDYKSINTQLLGIIVERATGQKLYDYLSQKIWQPLGMESSSTWNIDSKKNTLTRAFCCINATTHDFAKLGSLYLHQGNFNQTQIISSNWIANSTSQEVMYSHSGYKNQWWSEPQINYFRDSLKAVEAYTNAKYVSKINVYVNKKANTKSYYFYQMSGAYHAEGILGQFIYVNPRENLVIVRMGHYWKHPKFQLSSMLYDIGNKFSFFTK